MFKLSSLALALLLGQHCMAQDNDLLNMLDSGKTQRSVVTGTFKGTHLINGQSVEQPGKSVLQFIIMHRFGRISDGAYNFFGLDNATMRIGFDYGLSSRLSVGIGRSTLDKTFDGSLKYKVTRQEEGGGMPVSVSAFGSINYMTLKFPDKPYLNARYRTSYTGQLLVARKFTEALSLQVSPTLIHFNLVPTPSDKNTFGAVLLGGRYKVTKRMSVNAEYNWLPSNAMVTNINHNTFSTGIDIETGGHVFQLVFTNSQGMTEPYIFTKSPGTWGKRDIYFGFNLSRVFNFKK